MVRRKSLAQSVVQSNQINIDPMILFKEENELDGELFYDNKADIWPLGTMCYQLLVGSAPFDGQNKEKGLVTIPANLQLSKQCIAFVNSMMRLNPNDRVSIDLLSQDEFLTKDVDSFEKIELKRSQLTTDILFNINSSFLFRGLYGSTSVKLDKKSIISNKSTQSYNNSSSKLTKQQKITEAMMNIRETIERIKREVFNEHKSSQFTQPREEEKVNVPIEKEDLKKSYLYKSGNYSKTIMRLQLLIEIKKLNQSQVVVSSENNQIEIP